MLNRVAKKVYAQSTVDYILVRGSIVLCIYAQSCFTAFETVAGQYYWYTQGAIIINYW